MNQKSIIIAATAAVLSGMAFQVISSQDQARPDTKSVAWYVANLKEAKAQNQVCHDNPDLRDSENCQNALHALQISFKGGN